MQRASRSPPPCWHWPRSLPAAGTRNRHPRLTPDWEGVRIGLVAKSLGLFHAIRKGGDEAAAELGNTEVIFTGPTSPTARGKSRS